MGPLLALVGLLSLSVVPGFLMGGFFEQFPAVVEPRPWPMVYALAASGAYTYLYLVAIHLFPAGRPRGGAQRAGMWILLSIGFVSTLAGFLADPLGPTTHPLTGHWIWGESGRDWDVIVRGVWDATVEGFGFALVVIVVWKVVQYRRSRSEQQAQLKWLVFVLVLYTIGTGISFGLIGTEDFNVVGITFDAAFTALIPAAMAVAVLRYRLYEIDRLVSRTVSYSTLIVTVFALFALPAILISSRLGHQGTIFVAGATLAATAAFAPLRRRIQSSADRRFNRSRYDAQRELEGLAARLGLGFGLDDMASEVTGLVGRTLQPSIVGLWVRR